MAETLGLIKFAPRPFAERFFYEGFMYMNTIEYFQKLETDKLRGDPGEGLSQVWQAPLVDWLKFTSEDGKTVEFSGKNGKNGTLVDTLRMSTNTVTGLNIFCMYAVTPRNPLSLYIDPENFRFCHDDDEAPASLPNTSVFIYDTAEFFDRVDEAVRAQGYWMNRKLVEYVDPETHTGEMGAHRKFRQFSFQSEYRIAVGTGKPGPWSLSIGSLEGIAQLGDATKANSSLTLDCNLLTR